MHPWATALYLHILVERHEAPRGISWEIEQLALVLEAQCHELRKYVKEGSPSGVQDSNQAFAGFFKQHSEVK